MRLPIRLALLAAASVPLPGLAHAANGCADGTFSATHSPDGNATSILFDDFSAMAGGASGKRRATTTCRLSVPVTQPGGHTVYAVDYRGFATTEDGQTASLRTVQDGKQILQYEIKGPLQDDVAISDRVGVSGSETLDLAVILGAAGPLDENGFESTLAIDSIDFARIGYTTTASVVASLDQIARQRQSIALDLMDTAQNLLGQQSRFDEGSYVAAFASSDAAAGFNGRWEAGSGVSVLGGAAVVHANRTDVALDTLGLFAGAVRYTSAPATWRAFGEVGAWGSPDISASFSRSYQNLDSIVLASGNASGSLFSAYGRAGVIYAPDAANEFALSTRFTRAWLDLDGYDEDASGKNLFAGHIKGGRSASDTVSAEFAWSRRLDEKLDYTILGAVGRTFAGKDGAKASVDWVGDARGKADDQNFATLGGRVGWKFDERWQLDTAVSATFRENDKPDWNIGGQLKASF
ncbi:DUF4360 domain-containing protein [Shinella granuli]|uniref:Uncharacterized protein DUF4360 n=1 Tax=Shinella granuli TaxID=323621 RepID=A0A4R2D2P9_SHIGR|nr:DUF4360 domain-containing protein [Shinella granuli]TCN45539.1 uncharacterized protein DUF4360 [Shinella granuli]